MKEKIILLLNNGKNAIQEKSRSFASWYQKLYRNQPWYKRTIAALLTFIVAFFLYLFMVDINFLWLFGKSPNMSSIHDPEQPIASEIYSADGKLIGKFFCSITRYT